ncbi:MAG: molybdopterin-dependent oxidoreductase, partial [Desulfuromonadaceae bacterium]
TEIALAEALAKLLLENGWVDEAYLQQYVSNAADIKKQLETVNLEKAAETTGLSLELLKKAARYLGQAKNVAVLLGADLARSEGAEEKALAVANLAILCGALGSASGGVFPLDEKGNIQGLLDMGMASDLLPGGSDYAAAKAGFEQAWGKTLPDQGRTAQGILEGIEQGQIKILYLAGTNPLVSYPDSGRWLKALEKVETLIVQDILATELTELATVVLPGAADGEKLGSLTSLDHQLSKLGKVREPLGEAKDDLSIFAALYQRLVPAGSADCSLAGVIAEIKELVPGYAPQGACCSGGRCRPTLREPFRPKEQSLTFSKVKAPPAPKPGLKLLSGKILFHFGTTSTFAEANRTVAPSGYLEMNPEDAQSNGLKEGDTVKVSSAVGSAKGLLRLSDQVPAGLIFAPYHFAEMNIQQVLPSASNLTPVQVSKA